MEQVACVKSDAYEIGRHKAELSRPEADNADDRAVDRSNNPTLPQLLAEQDCPENGQNARDVVQTNQMKSVYHGSVRDPAPDQTTEAWAALLTRFRKCGRQHAPRPSKGLKLPEPTCNLLANRAYSDRSTLGTVRRP